MNKPLNDEVFDALLYVSRLETDGRARDVLKNQISSIVSYFDELERFRDEDIDENKIGSTILCNTERDLRPASDNFCYIEQKMLKLMNAEFMDGYFRTPKVLGSS